MVNVKAEMDVMVSMKWHQTIIQIQVGGPNAVNAIVPKAYSSNQYLHDPSSQFAKFFTLFTVRPINIKEFWPHLNVMYLNKQLLILPSIQTGLLLLPPKASTEVNR